MPRSISSLVAVVLAAGTLVLATSLRVAADEPGQLSNESLARLVRVCAPQVDSTTQAAIVAVESGGSALILHDDNDDRVYSPQSQQQAQSTLGALLAHDRLAYAGSDRGIDVGLAQINTNNLGYLGVSANDLLDPCTNLRASARIITDAYVRERSILARESGWRGDELALQRALQEYNSGRPDGDDAYVRAVYGTLDGTLVREVGGAAKVAPVPIIPLRFAMAPKALATPPAKRSALFYHASWAKPAPGARGHVDEFRP